VARARGRGRESGLDAWPGYVDALSTLLMVIIFVLLVFILAQAFLSVALSGRDEALDKVNRQLAELTEMLALERGQVTELRASVAQLNRDLQDVTAARDSLSQQLAGLRDAQVSLAGERDTLRRERDQLAARLSDAQAQGQAEAARAAQLQAQLAEATEKTAAAGQEASASLAQLADARRELERLRKQAAELDKLVQVDRATVQARLSELARLQEQVRALTALRDELERQAKEASARAMSEAELRAAVAKQLEDERKFSESARAQIALMTRQVGELRAQLAGVARALELAEQAGRDKDAQIANLGQRLNAALAAKVEELQRYRSDFFGKLREVLAGRPGIQVVGDRFVFQSEVLFPVGSAELSAAGREQIDALARTLGEIAPKIPASVPWVLRVDGHADRTPLSGRGAYASNWELSAARAITVVKQLIADGISAKHLAATGFGDNQPIDPADTPAAYAKNRRIELRLTDR